MASMSNTPSGRILDISVADSRFSHWKPKSYTVADFYKLLSEPIRGKESRKEFDALTKREREELKDVGGFVGGALKNGQRKAGHILNRCLITLDIDNVPTVTGDTDAVGLTYSNLLSLVRDLRCNYAVYPTRKNRPSVPRVRVVFPTNRNMTPDEYEPVARLCAKFMDPSMSIFDKTTFQAHRMMYWPSCCADTDYKFDSSVDAPLIDVDGLLRTLPDWTDVSIWPRCPGETATEQRAAQQQQLPTDKRGIVGAFCRVYDVPAAIEKFLPGVYDRDGNRLTYKAGSSANGAILYQDGQFIYSHHATDPAGEQLCNAFDLVRLHLFSDLDDKADQNLPIKRMPSYEAMCHLATEDDEVLAQLSADRHDEVLRDFNAIDTTHEVVEGNALLLGATADDSTNIPEPTSIDHPYMLIPPVTNETFKLVFSEKGEITNDLVNAQTLVETDPLLVRRIRYNELSGRIMAIGPFPWDYRKGLRIWQDNDYAGLKRHLNKYYKYCNDIATREAISLTAFRHRLDPLQEYIKKLTWDGEKRVETLFQDYLGAKDSVYTRLVSKRVLVGAIKRAMLPGCKFDYMVILTGAQGLGKSTLLRKLGKDWFDDTLKKFGDDKAAEHIQGFWILEIGELGYMNKQESSIIKQFLSTQDDVYRASYGHFSGSHPRRCVIFGTTNEFEFLKDDTGNRRFWPLDVGLKKPTKDIWTTLTESEVDQIWAEAYQLYLAGEPTEMLGQEAVLAAEYQKSHQLTDPNALAVYDFCNRLLPDEYYDWECSAQELFERNYPDEIKKYQTDKLHPRRRVCAYDVQQFVLDKRASDMTMFDARAINRMILASGDWEAKVLRRKDKQRPSVRGFERKEPDR